MTKPAPFQHYLDAAKFCAKASIPLDRIVKLGVQAGYKVTTRAPKQQPAQVLA